MLVVVAPVEREVRIEVGKGLEGRSRICARKRKSYREWRRGGSGSGGSYAPGYYGPSGGGGGGGGGFSGGGGSSGGGGASGSF